MLSHYSRLYNGLNQNQSAEKLSDQVEKIFSIVDNFREEPEEMKKYIAAELSKQSEKIAN